MDIKVEILIPLFYNPEDSTPDGKKKIEGEKYSQTFDQIAEKFPDYTVDNSPLLGNWVKPDTKKKVIDENMACWVICEESEENVRFFKELRETLKQRFIQDDILIYHIQVFRY